jgi:hypothetical protein
MGLSLPTTDLSTHGDRHSNKPASIINPLINQNTLGEKHRQTTYWPFAAKKKKKEKLEVGTTGAF